MKINIRKAIASDAAAILSLIRELAIFEKEPEAVIVTESQIKKDGFGASPLFECFVAEVADQIVGMALFYPRYSTWKGPTFHLEDLIVTESMKGMGVGTQLYNAFLKHAHTVGVERVEWAVLDWNAPAIKFYQKSGAKVLDDWKTVQMDKKSIDNYFSKINS
ncbi:MAG: GNAT family N-acetyltransferase [Flavobacteriaceae bacterium]|jgi:GNAT superfamily N-acetyltransferase